VSVGWPCRPEWGAVRALLAGEEWLERIADRCRRVYWLNPEPRRDWNTFDSELASYAPHCDATYEVRNLRQLVAAVEQLF